MKKNFTVHTTEDVPGLGMVGGFKVAGAACDIRNKNDLKRLDVALIVSETPATGAGVFTTNDVKAAPVLTDMAHLSRSEKIKAIVANSGNANACNGERGMADAMAMCKAVAELVGSKPEQVLVCSTGRIGEFLPMQKIEKGVKDAFEKLSDSEEQSRNAAAAILTSDTRPKTVLVKVEFAGKLRVFRSIQNMFFLCRTVKHDVTFFFRQVFKWNVGSNAHRPADIHHQRPHERIPRRHRPFFDREAFIGYQC